MTRESDREETLRRWIRDYSDPLLRLCCLYLADRSLAQDALQDTWIKAWHGLSRGLPENERAWLSRIAVNTCRDYARSAWLRHTDRRASAEDLPESLLRAPEGDRTLSRTVSGLPEKYRAVILLYYYQGLTLAETAKALGISLSAANRRLKKAEALLKTEWTGDGQL